MFASRRVLPALALLLSALVLGLGAGLPPAPCAAEPDPSTAPAGGDPAAADAGSSDAGATPARPPEPTVVLIGLYLLDIWGLDVSRGTYNADFYVWYRWKGEKFETNGIEYMNAQGLPVITENERVVLGDERYVCTRVRGLFKGTFPLHKYPFDAQRIEVAIEHQMLESHQMVFVADSKMFDGSDRDLNVQSREQNLRIPGWSVRGAGQEVNSQKYQTDWGHPRPTGKLSLYSRYTFTIEVARMLHPYLLKILLPLVVIVLVSFLVFFIEPSRFLEQLVISLGSFISAIIFHLVEARAMPEVGYLVVADKFFILSYFVIFLTIVQTVVAQGLFARGAIEKARMIDVVSRFVFPVMYLTGVLSLFFRNLD